MMLSGHSLLPLRSQLALLGHSPREKGGAEMFWFQRKRYQALALY